MKHKDCLAGIKEALMMGYDVSCRVEYKGKKANLDMYQHPGYRTALTYDIDDDGLNRILTDMVNYAYNHQHPDEGYQNPIKTVEGAEEILSGLTRKGFKIGEVTD